MSRLFDSECTWQRCLKCADCAWKRWVAIVAAGTSVAAVVVQALEVVLRYRGLVT